MHRKLITCVLLIVVASVTSATAQAAYTPEKGSAERKAILDALRVPVQRALKQKIVFVADQFKVQGHVGVCQRHAAERTRR